MSQYNVFQAIVMSFYSKNLYRDVALNWGAKAFLYLLLLCALSWILLTWQIQAGLNLVYKKDSDKIVSQIPVMTIKDGKLGTPENRPYIINIPDSEERLAVIDTSGTYTTLEQAKADFLVTETAMISRQKPEETKISQIPSTLNATIDPQVVNQYVAKYLGFIWIFLFAIFVIFSYIYRIIQALLYAIIGKLFSSMSHVPLTYEQILRISMVAITPSLILATIFDFFGISFGFILLFYFLLTLAYIFYGILANKSQPEPVVKSD